VNSNTGEERENIRRYLAAPASRAKGVRAGGANKRLGGSFKVDEENQKGGAASASKKKKEQPYPGLNANGPSQTYEGGDSDSEFPGRRDIPVHPYIFVKPMRKREGD